MATIVLVRKDSPILQHKSTEVINIYEESGEILVRTDMPIGEARAEPPHGLVIANVSAKELTLAQKTPMPEVLGRPRQVGLRSCASKVLNHCAFSHGRAIFAGDKRISLMR
jgi:hypothetical protein